MAALHQGEQSRHRRPVSQPVATVPERRSGVLWWLAGLVLLVATAYLLFLLGGYLNEMERRLSAHSGGEQRVAMMGREMDYLRIKLNGLLADSVEIRIKSLERAVAEGRVSSDEIQSFSLLQNDLNLLENYSKASGGDFPDSRRSEHARYQPVANAPTLSNQQLLEEVARIKGLFYLCLYGLAAGAGVVLVLRLRARSHAELQLDDPSMKKQRQIAHHRARRST